jgi:hypothetical protein
MRNPWHPTTLLKNRRPIGVPSAAVDVFSWDELIDGRLAAAKAMPGAVLEIVTLMVSWTPGGIISVVYNL